MKYKYLIIGGGVAGTTAAEILRQKDSDGSIAIVSDEPRFYSRIMLSKPNFFLGKVPFDQVWLREEKWYAENKIEFIGNVLAKKLDAKLKTVELSDGKILQYEKLLLATGGEAKRWPIAGADKKGICYLRDLEEAKILMESVKNAKQAVAVGSGFVSFEMCEMMRMAGLEVSLIMRGPYCWHPLLDEESGKMIEEAMLKGGPARLASESAAGGVKIFRNSEVSEILPARHAPQGDAGGGNEKIEGVIIKSARPSLEAAAGEAKIECQLALIGIGLSCNLDWIKEAGVEINKGILANEFLETNVPDVYAAGDVAEFNDLILGERVQLGNWVNAQMQGRTAALNMLASFPEFKINKEPFKTVSFYTCTGFGLNIAMSGDVRVNISSTSPDNTQNKSLETRKVIKRGSPESGSFARIIIDANNEIIGATFINRTQDMMPINKLIESNFKVSGFESQLSDPDFNLKQLLKN